MIILIYEFLKYKNNVLIIVLLLELSNINYINNNNLILCTVSYTPLSIILWNSLLTGNYHQFFTHEETGTDDPACVRLSL